MILGRISSRCNLTDCVTFFNDSSAVAAHNAVGEIGLQFV